MSQKEIVTVLKVNTENSGNNIKSLKQEIAQLKKALETAEIGSEEFAQASRDLATAQANLKTILADGKKAVDAADGSYNHLVATMAELKKQWKATADEAKRAEIGKEIDSINTKLKEMDATIGNHQRNVGNYTDSIVEAYQEIQGEVKKTNGVLAGSANQMGDVSDATVDYGKALNELNKTTEATRGALDGVSKMTSGVAGGFAAIQGVMALCGVEGENFNKVMVKLMAAMSIAEGARGLKDMIEGFGQLKTAFQAASQGAKIFGKDLSTLAKGAGATMLILGAFAQLLVNIYDKFTAAKRQQEEYQAELDALKAKEQETTIAINNAVASRVSQFEILKTTWLNLRTEAEKTKWIEDNQTAFNNLGIAIKSVADAQRVLVENAPKVITALQKQAEAAALQSIYQDLYGKKYNLESGITNKYKVGDTPSEEDLTYLLEKSMNLTEPIGLSISWERASGQFLGGRMEPKYSLNQYGIDLLAQKELDEINPLISELNTKIATLTIEANQILNELNSGSTGNQSTDTTDTSTTTYYGVGYSSGLSEAQRQADAIAALLKQIEEQAKNTAERARLSVIDTKEEELAELERIYNGEKALLEAHSLDTTNLTEEYNKNRYDIIKRYLDNEFSLISENTSRQLEQTALGYDTKALALDNPTTSILPSLKGDDNITPIQLEIDKTLELQAIREQAFNEQMAQIQAVLDSGILTAEQQTQLQAEYNAIQQQKIESTANANNQIAALNKQLVKQQQADNRELAKNITTTFTSALNAASNILSAVQEGIDTTNKEGFEKNKKLQIANATIGMLVGITNAIAGLFTTKSGPWDIALAAIQAGAIATAGGIQIANISKQTYDGSGGNTGNLNGGVGVSPNISMADMIPINYTKEVLSDTETAELNKNNRVYVVESDITETQNDVAVKETNSSF